MQPKQIGIFLLILFVVFLVVTDPAGAGEFARSFFSWVGDVLGSAFDFLDSLFEEEPAQTDTLASLG